MPLSAERIEQEAAQIARSLDVRRIELFESVVDVIRTEIVELHAEGPLLDLLRASVEANVDTILHNIANSIAPEHFDAPPAALEYAWRLAQHGAPVNALVRAYRLGHSNLTNAVFEELRRTHAAPELEVPVVQHIMAVMSDYIDRVSLQVVDAYERERERRLANQSSVRAVRVQEILAGHAQSSTGADINYPLAQTHVAVIAWDTSDRRVRGQQDALAKLERAAQDFAEFAEAAGDPLFIASDRATAWFWAPLGQRTDTRADLEAFTAGRVDQVALAVGTAGQGIQGFRDSHAQAQRAYSVAVADPHRPPSVTSYSTPGVSTVSHLLGDLPATRIWLRQQLGGLAADTEAAARLRETVRVYLASNMSNTATGKVLHLHYNSVKYRIKRAEELRGGPLAHDRLGLELALLACHWLGPAVLPPA
ncbi:PucR family transcriptional regulator [Tomitella biformata]|uniref:PucR family transcriptional regulator n=1 Tax=Tomitella biformata TaxID=630403 RepID=UPI000464776B|nr:helix-turn-helix domain-containing protein [Tomitella biformata]